MKDYLLRVLRQNRDELQRLKTSCWEEHLAAKKDFQTVKRLLESAERIEGVLDKASGADRIKLQSIAASYPDIDELRAWRETARARIDSTAQAHKEAKEARQKAAKEFDRQDEHSRKVKKLYGHLLAKKLTPWIWGEVITQLKDRRLHIYWGGQGHPLGPGHGHCVFTEKGLVYRRNPVKVTP